MKKKMKRPLAVLLALIMMFSTVSGTGLNLSAEELQTSEVEILTTEDSAADTEEDKSGDTKDINQEEAPEAENESEGDELTESEESEDEVEPTGEIESEAGVQPASEEVEPAAQDIGDIESEADVQPASEEAEPSSDSDSEENTQPASDEEDKSEPVTETEDDADDEESEKTETPAEITRYDYKSDEVNVLVTLTDPADLPDAAELVVEPITLQREAQKNIEEAAAEEGIFVEEIKAFDIKFMLEGEEVQPGATVKVSVSVPEFKPSEEASAVYHVDENNEVENMESEVAADGEVVFDAPHFSTYVIVDGSIINDATKMITVTLKHYQKDGYTEENKTSYQLYTDDVIEVPVGGEIYNYIKADNWKPDTVVVDYVDGSSATDVTYTSSADLKEISLTEDATVWVYYTPDQSSFYGEVGFYDYTVYTKDGYSVNNAIDEELEDETITDPILIVGDAKWDNLPIDGSKYRRKGKTNNNWNRGSQDYGIDIFGQEDAEGKIKYLDNKGNILFKYSNPGFFDPSPYFVTSKEGEKVYLREYYSDYQVGFTRNGNTYNFDQVIYPYNGDVGYYNKGESWTSAGKYFYPLDFCDYSQETSTYSKKESQKSNRFWGMRYDVTFTIGDYVGEMTFKSTTENDFLVVLDGEKLVVKSSGTNALTENVDLWKCLFGEDFEKSKLKDYQEELKKEHTLTILYIDRFAYNDGNLDSVCDISFTLPNVKIKEVVKLDENDTITAQKTTSVTLKTVDQSGLSLAGASFQLKNTSTAATETLTITEAEAGVTFKGLTVGEYQLMLANAPDNCVADVNEWKVIIEDQDGNLIISMIEEETGKTVTPTDGIYLIGVTQVIGTKLVLRTVSNKEGDSPLGGARFQLESDSTAEEKYSETKTSDFVTGEISFNGLSEGDYKLTHIKAPKGCQLEGNVSEWQVTITESSGNYSISMKNKTADEDGVYVYKYEVDEKEYVKPEEALTYDKTAKVVDWDERTYEIDISATALEVESIQQIDTTYGMFVFDKSSSMFNSIINGTTLYVGQTGDTFAKVKPELEKNGRTVVYRVDKSNTGSYGTAADYILYRDDNGMNGWYMYSCKNATWTEMKDETVMPNCLIYQTLKFDLLRDVAVTYVKNLFQNAPQSKIGITTFYSSGQLVKELASVSNSGGTFNRSILEEIFKIKYEDSGTRLGAGLELAYKEFFAIKEGETESAYEIAKNSNIPMYVIAVSDGVVDDEKKSEQFAMALKEKGIKVYTVVTDTAGSDKEFLKQKIASFGCAYETSDVRQLSEIFSQIQKSVSANTISNVKVQDYIDPRFVVLDESGNEITKKYYCDNTCAEDCAGHPDEKVEIKYNGEKVKVAYDSNGRQYVVWEGQSIIGAEQHWRIKVKAREDYIGGNNVKTNIDTEPIIITPENSYSIVSPTVNVKAELELNDNEFMIYKGETVPTDEEILNILFDRSGKCSSEVFEKYGISSDALTIAWYTDAECTESISETGMGANKPTSTTKYYLKVTYNAGDPSGESKANTTIGDSVYIAGNETKVAGETKYIETANKLNADGEVDRNYGIYTINVWELIKQDADTLKPLGGAEFILTNKLSENMTEGITTYYGKSLNESGSVVWYQDNTHQTVATNIAENEYILRESVAPDGYNSITTTWRVEKNDTSGWTTLPSGEGITDEIDNPETDEDETDNGIVQKFVNNDEETTSVVVEKQVTGNWGEKNKLFTFTATLKDSSNNNLTFPAGTEYTVDGTTATFYLADNETITLANIPVGVTLEITESDNANYTVTVSGATLNGSTATVVTAKTNDKIVFTNDYERSISTGILSDTPKVQNTLLAVTFAASVIGILAYLDRKRSKYDYRR